MAEEPHSPIQGHLRDIRGVLNRLEQDMADMKQRIGRLESQGATSISQVQVTLAEHSLRFDRLDTRLDRIERRLDLVGAES